MVNSKRPKESVLPSFKTGNQAYINLLAQVESNNNLSIAPELPWDMKSKIFCAYSLLHSMILAQILSRVVLLSEWESTIRQTSCFWSAQLQIRFLVNLSLLIWWYILDCHTRSTAPERMWIIASHEILLRKILSVRIFGVKLFHWIALWILHPLKCTQYLWVRPAFTHSLAN